MRTLPFVDEHTRRIDASGERVWEALLVTVGRLAPELPDWLKSAWGLRPRTRVGEWDNAASVGDSVPGFDVVGIDRERALVLRGGHRFARYELRFDLEPLSAGAIVLHATTSAAFPGLKGRLYRAAVIGTGGHRIAVRRILARVERRAERSASPEAPGQQPPRVHRAG